MNEPASSHPPAPVEFARHSFAMILPTLAKSGYDDVSYVTVVSVTSIGTSAASQPAKSRNVRSRNSIHSTYRQAKQQNKAVCV